jgi:Protein of unknown function (DUF3419).
MNNVIRNEVKQAINLKLSNIKKYKKYSKIYAFTTENIQGYYPYINFNNKSVLAISASGDHAINALLNGANIVDTFDINKLSKYYSELKYICLKNLEYDEFLEYFTSYNESTFNYKTFTRIKDSLSNDTYMFFEGLYRHFDYNGKKFRTSEIFNTLYDIKEYKIRYNEYLCENKYLLVQAKLKPINFILSSVIDLNKYVNKKYDIILLSNISDYINEIFKENYLDKYKKFIEEELSNLLKPNGQIVLAYIYDYQKNNNGRSEIDIEEIRKKLFNDKRYQIYIFDSAIDKNKKDAIIAYRKEE